MPEKKFSSQKFPNFQCGKAFLYALRISVVKGSMTIEAALLIPMFLMAVVSFVYLLEMMSIQMAIRSGLQSAAAKAMEESGRLKILSVSSVEENVVNSIGEERLDRSAVEGGKQGIDCSESYLSPVSGVGRLSVKYKIKLPVKLFAIPSIPREESIKIKAWVGYEKSLLGEDREKIVYITESGIAYHRDYHCTHIDLKIKPVHRDQLEGCRNKAGGKYYPCEKCGKAPGMCMYITETGDRYHNTLGCSGLKRTVYAVPISEAVGKGACSRCCR